MVYGENTRKLEEETNKNVMIVDLRSDTVTKPCRLMKQAMFDAEVGDDVCEEDPTVIKLQKYAAELMGKEAALFVTSGTMGNLISIMVHCNTRGCEIYAGEESHIVHHEQGGAAQIAGVTVCPISNNPDGTLNLKILEKKLRDSKNCHSPISRMIAVENTINGKVLSMNWLDNVVEFGKEHGLKLHMDGARLWNASVQSKTSANEIVRGFDSVTFCLSKGLGAPVGSLLCGTKDFIFHARRARKVLGGGMRQVGILAAAGFVALENRFRLHEDHRRAAIMMKTINDIGSQLFKVDPINAQTNMVIIDIDEINGITSQKFAQRLSEISNNDDDGIIIKAWSVHPKQVRLVFHLDITEQMFEAAQRKISHVIRNMDPQFHEDICKLSLLSINNKVN